MADARWKARERAALAKLGGTRLPSNGRAQPDGLLQVGGIAVAAEHKSRESLPGWLVDAVAQAARNAPDGTLPAVLLTAGAGKGRPCHRLAVVRLDDLPALLAAAAPFLGSYPAEPG